MSFDCCEIGIFLTIFVVLAIISCGFGNIKTNYYSLIILKKGGVVMLVIGAICFDNIENRNSSLEWCPDRSSTLAILIIGCLLFFLCCCGSSNYYRVRKPLGECTRKNTN